MNAQDLLAFVLGEVLIVIMAIIIVGVWFRGHKKVAYQAVIALIVTTVIIEIIKYFLPTARPYVVHELDLLPWVHVSAYESFPSGHSGAAFAMAAAVWDMKYRIGGILLIMALLVATGRVLLFVHFPWDVLVGGSIGTIVAFVVNRFIFKVKG